MYGERLKKKRKELGWSTYTLAERTGVAETTIRKWEQGKSKPKKGNNVRLHKALGIDLHKKRRKTPEQRALNSRLKKYYLDRLSEKTLDSDSLETTIYDLPDNDPDLMALRELMKD